MDKATKDFAAEKTGGALVSVVIPVYNAKKYLAECLDSLLAQTKKNIEIICVNDCSTDDSRSILESYAARDKRFKIIDREQNGGIAVARNCGLKAASGKYVYLLDNDDMITPDALFELTALSERENLDGVLFDTTPIFETERLKSIYGERTYYKKKHHYDGIFDGAGLFKEILINSDYTSSVWQQFWRREFLLENNLWFYDALNGIDDELFTFCTIIRARRIMCLNKSYHYYRRNENAMTAREETPEKSARDFRDYFIVYHERAASYAEAVAAGKISAEYVDFYKVFFESEYAFLRKWHRILMTPPDLKIEFHHEKYGILYRNFNRMNRETAGLRSFLEQSRKKKVVIIGDKKFEKAAVEALGLDAGEYIVWDDEQNRIYIPLLQSLLQKGNFYIIFSSPYKQIQKHLPALGLVEYEDFINGCVACNI